MSAENHSDVRATILIVDDEALFRTSATDALELAFPDYRIVQTGNGREALERIAELKVDVVVTDVSMPVMGGLELMLALREQKFRAPIIVVTAFGDPRLESTVSLQGAFSYLEKPIDLQELTEAIRGAVEGEHSHIQGLTLGGFVQLLALERKTCRLRISLDHRHGDLYFEDGNLVDAKLGRLAGDEAALMILSWDEGARLDLHVESKPRRRAITEPLNYLLLEAARLRDEIPEEPFAPPELEPTPGGPPASEETSEGEANSATSREPDTSVVEAALRRAMAVQGALGVALVDLPSGEILGRRGGDQLDLQVAGEGNAVVLQAKRKVMEELGLDDEIEDVLITLERQYHLIRPTRSRFLYLALERDRANLAMARRELMHIERNLDNSLL